MLFLTSLDNQNLLRGLEIIVVALIWLFFVRVIRAVWVEVRPPKIRAAADAPAQISSNGEQVPAGRRRRRSKLHLKVVEPDDQRGVEFELDDEVTLGRAPGCGVRVEDAYTSNIHARLFLRDGKLWVEDLASTNGTWVNAERITAPIKLGRGDFLQVGGTVFEVAR